MSRRPAPLGWACAIALALSAPGCRLDREEAERAVRAYDEAVILAYRVRDFEPLKEVATEAEWRRVVVLVDLKSSNRLVLESELRSLEISGVERSGPDEMRVRARERWGYHDRPLDPGRPRGPRFVVDMELEYRFVREGGRWKMDRGRTLSSEYLEPKGFVPGAGHGREAQGERAGSPASPGPEGEGGAR